MNDADPLAAGLATREPGFTLVTATQRLSARLMAAWDRRALARGSTAWCAPDILPWNAWLQRAFAALDSDALALGPGQELAVWEDIISGSGLGDALLHVPGVAGTAQAAWEIVHAWNLDHDSIARDASTDVQAFLAWSRQFDQVTRRERWLEPARTLLRVRAGLQEGAWRGPARLLFGAFDELTPAQQSLWRALTDSGTRVRGWWPRPRSARLASVELPTSTEEFHAAAHWARSHLDRNPDARLGIVVPELAAHRAQVERILLEVLDPPATFPGAAAGHAPFNISLGRPLVEYPLVDCALRVLELVRVGLPIDELGVLLRSPYLAGSGAERGVRALLDRELRWVGEPLVTLETLRASLDGRCPELAGILEALCALAPDWRSTRRKGAARWASLTAATMRASGWPGERPLDSAEYQTQEAWRSAIGRLAQLDAVTSPFGPDRAAAALQREAQETIFQPRTGDSPVQVLGALEAAGLAFDALWVTGLDADSWPRAPQPNPLLPLGMQRRLRLPHASSERELAYARLILDRLKRSAGEVILSYPNSRDDRALRPSPLLEGVMQQPPAERVFAVWREVVAANPVVALEGSDAGPGLRAGEKARGGSKLLANQSACPFRAFAEHRLDAVALREVEAGLGRAARGTLVHRVLELFWRDVHSHEVLAGLSQVERASRIRRSVAAALAEEKRVRPRTVTPAFSRLEQNRLERLLEEWLALEVVREPFTVAATEERRSVSIDGLALAVRVDRVDRLADGGLVFIDYKTGKADAKGWLGERPREPQLPLYSVHWAGEGRARGSAYARLTPGECRFDGFADADGLAPGMVSSETAKEPAIPWTELLAQWRLAIGMLVREFVAGHAIVDPREGACCRYCPLPPLCRVRELNARLGVFQEGGDGAA